MKCCCLVLQLLRVHGRIDTIETILGVRVVTNLTILRVNMLYILCYTIAKELLLSIEAKIGIYVCQYKSFQNLRDCLLLLASDNVTDV